MSSYVPTAAQLAGLLGIVAVAAMFIALGAAVGGRQRRAEADLVAGWGIVDAAFVALGAIAGITLGWILAAVIAAAIACAAIALRRMDRSDARGLMMWAALSIPLVLVVAAMAPSQWDEFTHWLPHTRYLLEHGDFVRAGMPPPSPQAAYPYGLPLVSTMASRLVGHFVENGAAIFNVVLLGNFGLVVARVIADARGGQKVGWGLTALGLLAAVALNPTFVPKIVFTAYADSATAVVLGIAAVLAWRALNALADGDPAKARALAWQLGLAATALVWLKQANLPLLGALMVAAALVALVDRRIAFVAALGLAVRALALPLAVWALWRIYLAHNLPGGEFEVRPFAQWALALLPDVVGRMASIASKKGGYFGIMIIAVGFAVRGLIRPRTPFDRLAIVVGVTFLLYNLFLLFTYIASFGDNDALRAASYWRYNTHLGGICVVFAAYAIALLWRWPLPHGSQPSRRHGIPADAMAFHSDTDDRRLKQHPDYRAAKSGDGAAAQRMVADLIPEATLRDTAAKFPAAIFAPVIAEERSGINATPATLAALYASQAGSETSADIVQINRAFHTGGGAMERLIARPLFDGPVRRGGRYVLVDDVTVLGGTLAGLADHIQRAGGEVVGLITLVNAGREPIFAPSRQLLRSIEERFGDEVRQAFGIETRALTANEARYLIGFRDVEEIRGRVAAAYRERADRLGAREVPQPQAGRSRVIDKLIKPASWAAIALVAIAPLALAKTIRFDDRAPKRYVRAVGAEIDRMLRPSDRIVLIDSTSAGELVVIMHYALHGRPRVIGDVTTAAGGTIPIPPETTHVWVHVPTPAVEAALDAKLPSGASYLLARMGGRWAIEKSWSYPGYRLPTDVPD